MNNVVTETRAKTSMGFTELKTWLRHKHPMVLLDRITDYVPGKSMDALMCISGNDDCIAGHFPERAIYPGTELMQAFSQAGIILLQLSTSKIKDDELTVVGSISARFYKVVVPGDRVELKLKVERCYASNMMYSGKAYVDGQRIMAFEGSIARVHIEKMGDALW